VQCCLSMTVPNPYPYPSLPMTILSQCYPYLCHALYTDGHTIGPWTASQANPDVNVTSPEADVKNHDGNVSNNGEKTTTCAAHNSKPCGEAKPSQLGFYSGPWLDVLIDARNNYRKMVHTRHIKASQNAMHKTLQWHMTSSWKPSQSTLSMAVSLMNVCINPFHF